MESKKSDQMLKEILENQKLINLKIKLLVIANKNSSTTSEYIFRYINALPLFLFFILFMLESLLFKNLIFSFFSLILGMMFCIVFLKFKNRAFRIFSYHKRKIMSELDSLEEELKR
jgi:hypothetical protein